MISDEKMTHIVHLMLTGIKKAGLVEFPREEEAVREAKKVCLLHLKNIGNAGETARARILSQKNPPLEGSPQWETLYNKYFEEEVAKKGG
jgi:hypothetical protein